MNLRPQIVVPASPREVWLTFDDGPDPIWTPRILRILGAVDAPATFFVVGCRVQRQPDLVREIIAQGHRVQPHCWDHRGIHQNMTRDEIERDIDLTLGSLRMVGVPTPSHWRPAEGSTRTPDTFEAAKARRLQVALWNVNPEDWKPEQTTAVMLAQLGRRSVWRRRSMILLHDGRINTQRRSAENTVDLIEPLVHHIRSRGGRFEVLGR